jgi:hypothetical protein
MTLLGENAVHVLPAGHVPPVQLPLGQMQLAWHSGVVTVPRVTLMQSIPA